MLKIINHSEYSCTTNFLDMVTCDKIRHLAHLLFEVLTKKTNNYFFSYFKVLTLSKKN